jgi:hypothetical protein
MTEVAGSDQARTLEVLKIGFCFADLGRCATQALTARSSVGGGDFSERAPKRILLGRQSRLPPCLRAR